MGTSSFLDAVRERVVIYDGATGTTLQARDLSADDFGGPSLEGCNEVLVDTRPDVVADFHRSFLDVGVDVVETDTFGGFATVLAEYQIADRAYELNVKAARIAKEVASGYPGRWVAGSMGPGTKLPSLGQIRFADLRDAYEEQARGLLDGGVDLLLIETVYDLLQAKAALVASRRAMAAVGATCPSSSRSPWRPPAGCWWAPRSVPPSPRSRRCGPTCSASTAPPAHEMGEHLRHLSQHSRLPISCLPNAGPAVDGRRAHALRPHARRARRLPHPVHHRSRRGGGGRLLRHHARAPGRVVERCRDLTPARREPVHEPGAASIYSAVPFAQETSFLVVGERTNANGSRKFRDAMLEADWDTCVQMAREQVKEGAHVLDVCVDYVGRDGTADMDEIASRFATQASVPLVMDSTEPPVMEAGLQWIGGRAILNSANLEDGEEPGSGSTG